MRIEIAIQEHLKLMKEEATDSHLTTICMSYQIFVNGIAKNTQFVKNGIISTLYDYWYEKSDKTKSANFWDEVIIGKTGAKLNTLRIF